MASAVNDPVRRMFLVAGAIFLVSQVLGMWAAADRWAAVDRIGPFLVATVVLLFLAATATHARPGEAKSEHNPLQFLRAVGMGALWLAAGISLTFLLFRPLASEAAAGALVILIPLGVGSLLSARHFLTSIHIRWLQILLLIAFTGFAWAGERSAWLALSAGVIGAAVYHMWRRAGSARDLRRLGALALRMAVPLAIGLGILFVFPAGRQLWLAPFQATPYNRLYIWQDALILLQDYQFTGAGLGQTDMVVSSYMYLFHVPFLYQVYNLWLQIGIEQGAPGIVGFAGMMTAAVWAIFRRTQVDSESVRWLCTATLAALIGLAVHGLLDAGLYVSRWGALLLLPLAYAVILGSGSTERKPLEVFPQTQGPARATLGMGGTRTRSQNLIAALPVLALAWLLFRPGGWAALQANLGATDQTRLELGIYAWPQWPIQDEVRRSPQIDLTPAQVHFERALRSNISNPTAHRRLGQIALSQGDYVVAHAHLAAAHQVSPQDRVTSLLLGEVYAAQGNKDRALSIWLSGGVDPHKLELREWWYSHVGAEPEAGNMHEAVAAFRTLVRSKFSSGDNTTGDFVTLGTTQVSWTH